ncbi:hypothetical protein IQ251_16735 [Saccharopolyspora sp. HNM0983]|uniref:Uncharacterized protein n=1 Tax=Saccharopolyspora montiporae TaxID=2781240 RepID=A0A929G0Y5_9PSEU|nr:hypothetical protein [Saccharopolyspora sp. HNM0983]MBE9376100.1 hypothetical protein [Saccharopolyspora sp. HNM0983]
MTKLSLQFHAAPDEALSLLPQWLQGMDVDALVERFFPDYRVSLVRLDGLAAEAQQEPINRVCVGPGPLDSSGTSGMDSLELNPDVLTMTLGTFNDQGLRETMLGAGADDPSAITSWRKVVNRARKSMLRGAWVLNPRTGARAEAPKHLYTQGAVQLYKEGVTLLAVAGWNAYEPYPQD